MPALKNTRLCALLAVGFLGLNAQAADFLVTNLADSGPGSLRQAVLDAEANDEADAVTFDDSLSGQIDLGDSLWIRRDLTITGFPEDPGRITIDGGGEDRIFNLGCGSSGTVRIEGLTLTNGRTPADDPSGGAIFAEGCRLDLSDMVITDNVAVGSTGEGDLERGLGGGVAAVAGAYLFVERSVISGNVAGADRDGVAASAAFGGGIAAAGGLHLEIEDSVISNNHAAVVNVLEDRYGGGGVGADASTLTIRNSTVSGNTAGNRSDAGGRPVYVSGGGVLALCPECTSRPSLWIRRSTISDNFAGNSGTSGPVAASGGGVFALAATITDSSTISGNVVGDLTASNEVFSRGGGLVVVGAGDAASIAAAVAASTIADNQALGAVADGGGIVHDVSEFILHHAIVAANSAVTHPDAMGAFDSSYSIIENHSGVGFTSGSAIAGSPNLGPLTDNGGPTETHAITNTSLAYNAGDPLDCPETDQRGVDRPQLGVCDIGAFELAVPPVGPTLTETFDGLVEARDLVGTGLGRSAARRLNAMRNMMLRSDALMEAGDSERACEVLSSALLKTDGQSHPPDLVQGPGTVELAAAIEDAQGDACL